MKDVKKYRLVPLSYSPTKNEAEQETIEKKLRDILEDRELSSSEKLARYEDALKRRDLGSMQEVKETTRPIPSLPTIPKIEEPAVRRGEKVIRKANLPKKKKSRTVVRKPLKRLVGRGSDSLVVDSW